MARLTKKEKEMSYSAAFLGSKEIANTIEARPQIQPEGVHQAYMDHWNAILKAIEELVKVVGPVGGLVSVNVSGHANPNHEPSEGWSNEFLSINISAA